MEGDPILINQTQINIKSHKTTSSHIKPHPVKVVVLTDVPPGSPSIIAQIQDGVNTVGPVPMTFGHGPNTFPHSAAHVLNTNYSPSNIEGNTINKIYTSAANHNSPSSIEGVTKHIDTSNFSGIKMTTFTQSSFQNKYIAIFAWLSYVSR